MLYRNAQEAITNAVRHGGATAVSVELRYGRDEMVMSVSNNGSLPAGELRRGIGLSGMAERVAMLGGNLRVERDGAFRVISDLPYYETASQAEGRAAVD